MDNGRALNVKTFSFFVFFSETVISYQGFSVKFFWKKNRPLKAYANEKKRRSKLLRHETVWSRLSPYPNRLHFRFFNFSQLIICSRPLSTMLEKTGLWIDYGRIGNIVPLDKRSSYATAVNDGVSMSSLICNHTRDKQIGRPDYVGNIKEYLVLTKN